MPGSLFSIFIGKFMPAGQTPPANSTPLTSLA